MAHSADTRITVVQVVKGDRGNLAYPFNMSGMKRVIPHWKFNGQPGDIMLVNELEDRDTYFIVSGEKLVDRMVIEYEDGFFKHADWGQRRLPYYDFGSPIDLPNKAVWQCESFWEGKRRDEWDMSWESSHQRHGLILIKEGAEEDAWTWLAAEITNAKFFSTVYYSNHFSHDDRLGIHKIVDPTVSVGYWRDLSSMSPETISRFLDHITYPRLEPLMPALGRWMKLKAMLRQYSSLLSDSTKLPKEIQCYRTSIVRDEKMFLPLRELIYRQFVEHRHIASTDALAFLIEHADELVYPEVDF